MAVLTATLRREKATTSPPPAESINLPTNLKWYAAG